MPKDNIIVAFATKKACNTICNILKNNGIYCDNIVHTVANIRIISTYYENGIIICGGSFADEPIFSLIDDLCHRFKFIVIEKCDSINAQYNDKVYRLFLPIRQEELLLNVHICIENFQIKSKNEYIEKAKKILFLKYNFTENNAHKYIQNLSMKYKKKSEEIAKLIIKKNTK